MILLITGTVCGLAAFLVALILQFRLPHWLALAGLGRLDGERLAKFDLQRMRRRLSILMYFASVSLLGGTVLLHLRVISGQTFIPALFLVLLAVFDGVWFVYRRFDHTEYSPAALRAGRIVFALSNAFFLFLSVLFMC